MAQLHYVLRRLDPPSHRRIMRTYGAGFTYLERVREALEKLPGVIYMNQLVESGLIRFQSSYHKRE